MTARSRFVRLVGSFGLATIAALAACGGGNTAPPKAQDSVSASDGGAVEAAKPVVGSEEARSESFVPTSGPGDSPVPFVRDERSGRLDTPMPRGKARILWRTKLQGDKREACRGGCAPRDRAFMVAAGNRVAFVESDGWQLFDSRGRRIDSGSVESGGVRLDRAGGTIVADEAHPFDLGPDVRVASRNGLVVTVANGAVHVGERAIEGKFDAFDVSVDESDVAVVVVRQGKELLLWTIPLAAGGSIGRQKLPPGSKSARALGPPILGSRIRVFVLDTGLLALGLDGKRLWEKRGLLPTGGVSVTADDRVLVADGGRILALDARGQAEEIWSDKDVTFVTPPIVDAQGTLFVASGDLVHALTFKP